MSSKPTDDIWTNAFRNNYDVDGTASLKGKLQTKLPQCFSKFNTKKVVATIAYPVATAVMSLVKGQCAVGLRLNGDIYCECKSSHSNKLYVVSFNPSTVELYARAYEGGTEVDHSFVSDTFCHWSIFVPRIVHDVIKDKSFRDPSQPKDEVYQCLNQMYTDFKSNGSVLKNNEPMFVLNDNLYLTKHEYVTKNADVNTDVSFKGCTLKEDVTAAFGGKHAFELAAVAAPTPPPAQAPSTATSTAGGSTSKKGTGKSTTTSTKKASGPPTDLKLEWDRELTDEEKSRIPNLDYDLIEIPDNILQVCRAIKEEHGKISELGNVLQYGEGGGGKSTNCKIIANLLGLPYRVETFHTYSDESAIEGKMLPKGTGFEFVYTPFAKTYVYGGVIELAELTLAKPGALGLLNTAMDDTKQLVLANGEVHTRHPNCIIVATTNVNYAGCNKFNEALKDRFQYMLRVVKPAKDKLIEITVKKTGNTDRTLIGKMIDVVINISTKIQEEQITGGVCSSRQLYNWARDVKYTKDPLKSAEVTILPGVSLEEDIQNDILETVIKPVF